MTAGSRSCAGSASRRASAQAPLAARGAGGLMRVLVATDAWHPQVNGVVRTLTSLAASARKLGVEVVFLNPEGFASMPVPTYPGLRCALPSPREIARRIEQARPDAIHIATEGTIGHLVRHYCLQARPSLHHQLYDAISRIHRGAAADPGSLDLRGAAPLPFRRHRHDGLDPLADRRVHAARFQATSACGRAASTPTSSSPSARSISVCRGRSSCASGASPSRRTWRPSSRSTFRARRS